MKLTQEQIAHIEQYIKSFDIKYYEVYMEILDHMILSVEDILEHDKEITFEDAVLKAKVESFGKKGFRGMMTERTKALNNKNRKEFNLQIKNYLYFHKIVMTFFALVGYYFFISSFEKPQNAHTITMILLLIFGFTQILRIWKFRKKEKFFVLKTEGVFMFFNLYMIGFHLSNAMIILGKESIDFNHIIMRLFMALVFTFTFILSLIFIEIRKKTIKELQTQIFV